MLDGTTVTWRAARSPSRLNMGDPPPTVTVVGGRVRVRPTIVVVVVAVMSSVETTVTSRVDVAVTTEMAVWGL